MSAVRPLFALKMALFTLQRQACSLSSSRLALFLSSSSCCFRMTLSIGPSHLSFSAASLQFSLVAVECCSLCNSVLASSSLKTKCWYRPHQQIFHFMLLCVIPHAHEVRRIIQLRTFANLFPILCGMGLIVFGMLFLASSPRRFRVGQVAVSGVSRLDPPSQCHGLRFQGVLHEVWVRMHLLSPGCNTSQTFSRHKRCVSPSLFSFHFCISRIFRPSLRVLLSSL